MRRRRREIEVLNHASFIDALFLFIGALIFILMIVVMLIRDLNLFELVAPGGVTLPSAIVGRDYEFILPIFGGNERYDCELTSGALIDGLHLMRTDAFANGTCGVVGVPTRTTTEPMRMEFLIRDSSPEASPGMPERQPKAIRRVYELAVLPPPVSVPPPRVLTRDVPAALVARPYRLWLSAMGGIGPYRWELNGDAPPGLALDPSGLLSGSPPRIGHWTLSFRVRDATGRNSEWTGAELTALLDRDEAPPPPPPVMVHTRLLPDPVAGHFYELALSAVGGVPPYNWRVEGGLPPGLACCRDGYLTGTPTTAGRTRFSLRVTGTENLLTQATSASREVEIVVDPPPPIIEPLRLFR